MRIFYASDTSPNPDFNSDLWRNNLYLPLVDMGHEVIEFDYNLRETFKNLDPANYEQNKFIRRNRLKLSKELLNQIKKAHDEKPVDLFFSYFYDACVFPETIDEIKRMGIKTVNWYCNGSYQLHLVKEISPHYDWCLVPEKFRMEDYKNMGAKPIYCQEAANPNIYKPYDLPYEFDVTFIGQAYGERPEYVKYILDQDIDIKVWGSGWQNYSALGRIKSLSTKGLKHASLGILRELLELIESSFKKVNESEIKLPYNRTGQVLPDIEMIKTYSRSKINLGFSSCGDTHIREERILQVRLRDFEVPMSGGFYMVEYMEELEEFFDIGKEIVCYKDKEDLAEKIKYYLKNDNEREAIRKAGYERCLRDHTWHKRFEMAFKKMEL
ncbi:MAG: hypothetical protein A2287_09475 [Candidatus Melainabacteria bacterium RIFOXYA12_FULL_32_12]|nr:MAG: hypothetical protein A2255_08385 [Candidatus Melainabacteria bacterium RIFOXYA2_FULL_32_9]OGI26487.1 MAG: hypothetical protein A2287_09475 [Candidatus Melainabacteria bacterium RIFOXYA12_FULL_32_12]